MNPKLFQIYRLKLEQIDKKRSSISEVYEPRKEQSGFSYPSTNRKAKIYVVKEKDEIVYVGITVQPIASRLRYGLNPITKNGYHGYKWKHLKNVSLLVWSDYGEDRAKEGDLLRFERIEGEIVYLVRKYTGKWPKFQTEIHFHNGDQIQKNIAGYIFRVANNKRFK